MATTAAQMVADAKTRTESLTADQVATERDAGEALVVDIRDADQRSADGAIPGAIHASRGMLEFYADPASPYHRPEFDPGRRTILHCASGGRSALAADTLRQLGYGDVAHLEGGLNAWKETGRAVEPGEG